MLACGARCSVLDDLDDVLRGQGGSVEAGEARQVTHDSAPQRRCDCRFLRLQLVEGARRSGACACVARSEGDSQRMGVRLRYKQSQSLAFSARTSSAPTLREDGGDTTEPVHRDGHVLVVAIPRVVKATTRFSRVLMQARWGRFRPNVGRPRLPFGSQAHFPDTPVRPAIELPQSCPLPGANTCAAARPAPRSCKRG